MGGEGLVLLASSAANHRVRFLLAVATLAVYSILAIKTVAIADHLGKDKNNWGLYAVFIPGISYLHALLLKRRQQRPES